MAAVTWLKAIQAHQSIIMPMMALVALPMGGSLALSHRPMRGPSILAAATVACTHITCLALHSPILPTQPQFCTYQISIRYMISSIII